MPGQVVQLLLLLLLQENQAAAVQELVKLGASPNCKTSSGSTPLHVAAQVRALGAGRQFGELARALGAGRGFRMRAGTSGSVKEFTKRDCRAALPLGTAAAARGAGQQVVGMQ